ncbi:MAG: hypothetical protein Q7K71_04085 [Candidatus Omnitrophota bacterium]|nr:hypothetical protein [Candidatus Omnitrophota bacterium]
MKNYKGQAALVLILLAAIALIFFAVTLNWGRVSQIKNMTTTAATNAAANTVSGIASYGESLIQSSLGGGFEKSGFARWVVVALSFIAAALIIYFTAGAGTHLAAVMITLAIGGAAATLITVYNDVKTVKAFNQMHTKLPLKDRFLEQGLSAGAQSLVSDQGKIIDYFDINTNGKFGPASDDKIGRYGFFYTERLKALKRAMSGMDLTVFLDGLGTLLGEITEACPKNPDGTPNSDPHCNKCCVPLTFNGKRLRPASCLLTVPAQCAAADPSFPFIYDPTYPKYSGGTSFLATFGVDVEKKVFKDRQAEAKGIFSLFWDMGDMRNTGDGLRIPGPGGVRDYRRPDKVKISQIFHAVGPDPNDPDCVNPDSPLCSRAPFCADKPGLDPNGFWWREGADQYCSTTWPYNECPRNACTRTSCPKCTPATAADWPEDPMDDIVYSLKGFYAWAKLLLAQDDDTLRANLKEWYPEAAVWIGPECDGSNALICQEGGGVLYRFENRLTAWRLTLTAWLNSDEDDVTTDDLLKDYHDRGLFLGITPYVFPQFNAWCMPRESDPQYAQMTPDEIDYTKTFDTCPGCYSNPGQFKGNPWGSLNSVIACLDWNSTNDVRFKTCKDALDALSCATPSCAASFDPCDASAKAAVLNGIAQQIADVSAQICTGTQAQISACETAKQNSLADLQACASSVSGVLCPSLPAVCQELPRSLVCEPAPPEQPQNCPVPAFDPCATPSLYKKWVDDSYDLSGPQSAQFTARKEHLRTIKGNTKAALGTVAHGKMMLDNFLYGTMLADGTIDPDQRPVPSLFLVLQDYQLYLDKMPNFLVYGWQSPVDPKNPSRAQHWHMVRAEGMGPGKCPVAGMCEYGTGNRDNLPHIEVDTDGFLWTRQHSELKDYDGRVLTRVTRWDEERPATTTFNNTVPVWNFHFGKPGTVPGSAAGLSACQRQGLGIAGNYVINSGTAADQQSVGQAFMLNTVGSDPFNTIPASCWATVDSLLSQGTKTTVCAVYTGNRSTNHMEVKFVPCPAGAFDENTLGR